MRLLSFQTVASEEIATRYLKHANDPESPYETKNRLVPLFQNLSAITGAGKTIILANAVEEIRERLQIEPVVLWVSKGKVVVSQTLLNLESGKYKDLIPNFTVAPLADCSPSLMLQNRGLLLMATVATFNQKDRARRVFKLALDKADQPIWDIVKLRETSARERRPLFVVYDEGHNLSDQQTDLILGLEPNGIISASATPKITGKLAKVVGRLKDAGWTNDTLTALVKSTDVGQSGLIKSQIVIGGYVTSMEHAVREMYQDFTTTQRAAIDRNAPVLPKAIYICETNIISEGKTKRVKDDPRLPFAQRKARPIVIWRFLVNQLKIAPATIVAYCDLEVDRHAPLPDAFNLLRGGEGDYEAFIRGNYKHIIFNLALQEGWDDPECYFAYVDKAMGSETQVAQAIGRVLRQPGAQHYEDPRLNSASFYIRLEERSIFARVLDEVKHSLEAARDNVEIIAYTSTGVRQRITFEPKSERFVPRVSVEATAARVSIAERMRNLHDYRADNANTKGTGARTMVRRRVGEINEDTFEWMESTGANKVTGRTIFVRKVSQSFPRALNVCDLEDKRLDALVEQNSVAAAELERLASDCIDLYLRDSLLKQKASDLYKVGPINVDPNKLTKFRYSLHEGYGDLNEFEKAFANALDKMRLPWCRNPARSGYGIPLLTLGKSSTFYPDFLVWRNNHVFALDPKGDHLIVDDAARKLLDIEQVGRGLSVHVRLIAAGSWDKHLTKQAPSGYTVFSLRSGRIMPSQFADLDRAVRGAVE
jgi:type III restriction enzyme